ncbi:AAA family ATPase [Aerococcaceae bacterium DSM 111022]|nr:AAA family ATPase [Aerococcaceae bacterium DSM 111022]
MKIKQIDIYGYGKWVDQTFEINDVLQVFYGPNESGKSTIQSFIRSILFGFPSKRRRKNQINRFEPKHSDTYGGRLLLTDTEFGDVWVERTNNGLKLTTTEGDRLEPETLDQILGGLDEVLFDSFYGFNLQNLQELANVGSEQLNDYFLSIGTMGSDKFLAIAKQFEKESDTLYRPQGSNPTLNKALIEYERLAERLETAQTKNKAYNSLVMQRDKEIQEIEQLNKEIEAVEEKRRGQDQLMHRYDIYLKNIDTKQQLAALTFTEIPDDAATNLAYAQKMVDENKENITKNEERIAQFKQQLDELTRLNWAKNHEEERKQWIKSTNKIKDTQTEFEQTTRFLVDKQTQLQSIAQKSQFYPEKMPQQDEYNKQVEAGLNIQLERIETQQEIDDVQAERRFYIDQRKEQQSYSTTVRQQIVTLESQRLNDEERLIQETSLKEYMFGIIFIVVGIVFLIQQYISNSASQNLMMLAGAMVVVGIVISLVVLNKHRKLYRAFNTSPIIDKLDQLHNDEQHYIKHSKELGSQITARDAKLSELAGQIESLDHDAQKWLVNLGFYPTADMDLILKTNPVEEYYTAQAQAEEYKQELDRLTLEVTNWKENIRPLLDRFPMDEINTRAVIRHHEEIEAELAQTIQQGQELNRKITQAQEEIEKNKQSIKEHETTIEDIFKVTQSDNLEQFNQKVATNQRIQSLEKEQAMYQEQIAEHLEALTAIESKQALVEDHQKSMVELDVFKRKIEPHRGRRADLTAEIKQLERDGTVQLISQELADKEAEVRDLILVWGKKRMGMEMLYQTLRKGLDNPLPEMTEIATEIFSKLSYGRYKQVKINKKDIRVVHHSDVLFEPYELSQGTLEQLYIALRLAFIISAKDLVKMPIIIDDAFVNFDDMRKASMYQVLDSIAEEIQILFFTFDEQIKEMYREDQIIDLTAIK